MATVARNRKIRLSSTNTNGPEESVLFSEVSSFQRLSKEWYLEWEKVSYLER